MDLSKQAFYDTHWESWLDMKVHGPASRWLRFLIHCQIDAIANVEGIQSVLDIGCGEGTTTHSLAKQLPNAQVVGVDVSRSPIQFASARYRRPNLKFLFDESLEELDRQYDLVCAFEVLEHVEDWQELLRRICRSATKLICLSFPIGRMRRFEEKVGHYRNFKRGEVERALSRCGFEARIIFYAGFPFFSPIYRELCNAIFLTRPPLVTGKYGIGRIFLSQSFYFLFRFLSSKHRFGDQFCGLFSVSS